MISAASCRVAAVTLALLPKVTLHPSLLVLDAPGTAPTADAAANSPMICVQASANAARQLSHPAAWLSARPKVAASIMREARLHSTPNAVSGTVPPAAAYWS
nr:MAG TPA: hypothetical protein [Caudoviricetes sp.]